MTCEHNNKAIKIGGDKMEYLVCEDCGGTLAKVMSRACQQDHSKYVGKCPYCGTSLPGVS